MAHNGHYHIRFSLTAFPGTPGSCLCHESVSAGLAGRKADGLPCFLALGLVSLTLYLKLLLEIRLKLNGDQAKAVCPLISEYSDE